METVRADYRDALQMAQVLSETVGALIRRRMLVGGHSYNFTPISHLHRGMRVLVTSGSDIVDVPVDEVSREQYSGPVYDLEVADAHNYVANGIVVHNSVYAFRGAFPGVLDGFLADYPEAQTIKLGQNYRSTKKVLAVAGTIISPNPTAARAELWTENEHGEDVRMVSVGDDRDEAAWVIADLKRQTGTTAIIVRMNAQTKPFEDVLMSSRIPFQLVGAQRFFDRAEVRDTMSWLRAALNPGDYLALSRAAGSPKRGLGEKTLAEWFAKANERGITPIALAEDELALAELGTRGVKAVYGFAKDVASVARAAEEGPEAALKQVVKIGMVAGMERERAENVNQLLASAADFDPTGEGGLETTRDFVESVALTGAADAGSEAGDAPPVYLITAHAAKGREFDNVYVVGAEDGIYPHSKAEGEVALQEERRLLFVATSRAKARLTISWCSRRNRFGHYEDAEPSPFLEGLEEHTTPIEISSARRNVGDWTKGTRLPSQPAFRGPRLSPIGPRAVAAEVDPSLFSVGMEVLHPTFGRGTVKEIQGANIRIRFGDTPRTLALAYARLTPVEPGQ
jgi:DNA helicase-2/ATP-dependent DNA helicase PcrA